MSEENSAAVLNDGTYNYLEGRNLMPRSESPVFTIQTHDEAPSADTALADITVLAE